MSLGWTQEAIPPNQTTVVWKHLFMQILFIARRVQSAMKADEINGAIVVDASGHVQAEIEVA